MSEDDPDRAAILARRKQFIALALSGLATTGCTDGRSKDEDGKASKPSVSPQPPRPCLDVAAPPPASESGEGETSGSETGGSETGETGGSETAGSETGELAETDPPQRPDPRPRPCLRRAAPDPKPEPEPAPKPCLKKPKPKTCLMVEPFE